MPGLRHSGMYSRSWTLDAGSTNPLTHYLTQYIGLNPNLVKNSVTKAADHVNAATTVGSALFGSFAGFSAGKAAQGAPSASSSAAAPNAAQKSAATGWGKWVGPTAYAIGGALLAGAAAGGAYYARDHLNTSYTWLMDHMKYVGNLWDETSSQKRLEALVDIDEQHGVVFRKCERFFVLLPRILNWDLLCCAVSTQRYPQHCPTFSNRGRLPSYQDATREQPVASCL